MLITSVFSFSHNVFKRSFPQGHKKLGLSVKGLPVNNTFLDFSKLKAFADNRIKGTEKSKSVMGWVESIVAQGFSAGYHCFFFPQCFHQIISLFQGCLKSPLCSKDIFHSFG